MGYYYSKKPHLILFYIQSKLYLILFYINSKLHLILFNINTKLHLILFIRVLYSLLIMEMFGGNQESCRSVINEINMKFKKWWHPIGSNPYI